MASWNVNGKDLINAFAEEAHFDAMIAFEDEAIRFAGSVIQDTPIGIDGGTLRSNWQIAKKVNNRVFKGKRSAATRNGFAHKKIRGKFAVVNKKGVRRLSNKSLFMFNNSPYGRVVEFGGYPSPVKKGTYNRRTRSFEIRSRSGFSKQAPRGMVRLNMIRFKNRLRRRGL